jgi:cell wall hydrolase
MRKACARILIGLAIVSSVAIFSVMLFEPGIGGYIPTTDIDARTPDIVTQAIDAQSEPYCVALAVYFEGGSTFESEEGQRQIARVVVERARANLRKWGGANLCDVVFYKRGHVCQFSFACLPVARRTPHGGPAWERALEIARQEIEGGSDADPNGISYYMNPALTSDRNACRFRKEFVPVLEAGRHQFFREPTEEERAALAKSDPVECQRYQAALEAKKRAAKLAAEQKKRRLAAVAKKRPKKVRVADR